jgi:hypothetical protein
VARTKSGGAAGERARRQPRSGCGPSRGRSHGDRGNEDVSRQMPDGFGRSSPGSEQVVLGRAKLSSANPSATRPHPAPSSCHHAPHPLLLRSDTCVTRTIPCTTSSHPCHRLSGQRNSQLGELTPTEQQATPTIGMDLSMTSGLKTWDTSSLLLLWGSCWKACRCRCEWSFGSCSYSMSGFGF